jgi:hypothetical protein
LSAFLPPHSTFAPLPAAVAVPLPLALLLLLPALVLLSLPQAVIMPVNATAVAAATHILVGVLLSFTSLAFWVGCASAQITAIPGDTQNLGPNDGRPLDHS